MNTEQLKTAKQLIQERLGSNVVFSIDGQMIGDINAQEIVVLMQDFANQEIKRAVEKDRESRWISVDIKPDSIASVLGLVKTINGKLFHVKVSYTKGHEIEYWDDDYQGEYDEFEEKNGTLYLKPGWYEECDQVNSEFDTFWIKREVILWQPLPEAPKL